MTPYGLCKCGCGEPAPIATNTSKRTGRTKGEPMRFVHGHNRRGMPRLDRLTLGRWHEEDRGHGTPCWIWDLALDKDGYGMKKHRGVGRRATHVLYEHFVGAIPEGLQIDHLCRVPACVNPDHLEPVTQAENTRRGRLTELTWGDVAAIRASTQTSAELAPLYPVTADSISRIRRGERWNTNAPIEVLPADPTERKH